MLNKEQVYQVIDTVLTTAMGYDCRVIVMGQAEGLTRFANSEIHQNVFEDSTDVTITITQGKKRSQISTNLYSAEGLEQATLEAIANLDFLPEGEEQPPLVDSPAEIAGDSFNQDLADAFSVNKRALLVKAGLDTVEAGYLAYGALSYAEQIIGFGNSKGVKRFHRGNGVNFSALIAHESGGSGFTEILSNSPQDFDVAGAFKTAYDKAKLNQNPEEIQPGAYTVVLEPLAVGDILTYLSYLGFSAKSVQNQVSFLTGKLDQKVFGDNITIIDNFQDENTVTLPFDFEGAPRQKVSIIEAGVAKGLTYDMASALKDQVETTGHSINMPAYGGMPLNLVMAAGNKSLEEIIAGTQDGLLVTRFHYMNPVNPRLAQLTALTRDGLFRIKDGKVVGAVKNMRFTESMLEALQKVEEISQERVRTAFFFGNYYVPALKINNFHFTGKTDA